MAATYDAWLAVKAPPSASAPSGSVVKRPANAKRKAANDSPPPHHRNVAGGAQQSAAPTMGPPPTTPGKRKRTRELSQGLLRTPTKTLSASPSNSVHDSGGSVVDVPLTPKAAESPSLRGKQRHKDVLMASPSSRRIRQYEDGGSPSKLRALLSSFSSIQRTPTKTSGRGEDDNDRRLLERLVGGSAFTPRTKARKRLRGEVVVTPEKARAQEQLELVGQQTRGDTARDRPAPKKKRGMALSTLRDYGMVPIAGPQSKAGSQSRPQEDKAQVRIEAGDGDEGDDGDDDQDMLGPSPSVDRIVDRPVKAFRPLFGVVSNGQLNDDDDDDRNERVDLADGLSVPAPQARAAHDEEGEEQDVVIVPYQRYERGHFRQYLYSPQERMSDDEDDLNVYGVVAPAAVRPESPEELAEDSSDDDAAPVLDALTLNSPQCKRARNMQRIKAERHVQQLLGAHEEDWRAFEGDMGEEHGRREGSSIPPRSNKVGPPIKGGKLRKGFKDVTSAVAKSDAEVDHTPPAPSSALVFANDREQAGSDDEQYNGEDDSNDEWASDVSSAGYGLGDGYMSDNVE